MERRVGTAGWGIPREARPMFDSSGSLLERYARRFSCVEINSCFYRPHRAATYARWAASVPNAFRFSLKLPKTITHELRLRDAGDELEAFLESTASLGEKRDVILVQMPPSLSFEAAVAEPFFELLRGRYAGRIACEPRHATWFDDAPANALLEWFGVARVAADPPIAGQALAPGGARSFEYWRLHGAPHIYYSAYDPTRLSAIASRIARAESPAWCVFDNTAMGAAIPDAFAMLEFLSEGA
jgi:uncharacterized protein YecE (DUF72 family)